MFCYAVSCCMPVFVTYLPYQTFSRLVTGNSYKNISRLCFKNNLDLEAAFGKIVYVQILVNIIVIFFLRSVSGTNSKDFCKEFPLSVVVASDNTRTDLQIGLFPSGVSSKHLFAEVDFGGVAAVNSVILPCNDSWTNEYSGPRFRIFRVQGLQTQLEGLSHFTTSNPALWRFWAKISPLQSFLLDGLKRFSVEILLLPNLTLKLACIARSDSLGILHSLSAMLPKYFDTLFWFYTCPGKFTSAQKTKHFIGLFMTVVDRIKCWYTHSGITSGVGGFQNPGVYRQAFPSFLPHPFRAYLCRFSRGLCCTVFDSGNSTETLATQASR